MRMWVIGGVVSGFGSGMRLFQTKPPSVQLKEREGGYGNWTMGRKRKGVK